MADKSQSFRDVLVWRKAHAFTLAIWRAASSFPREEMFVIASRPRRAAMRIPSHFVEGFRKRTTPDKIKSYNTAQGSADESLYQRIPAHDPGHADTTALLADPGEDSRLLQACINGLERDS